MMAATELKDPIHFIGIGGSGMSALAELVWKNGQRVQGSDHAENDATERLRTLGIKVDLGHAASHLKEAKTIVYSSAIKSDNPELLEAKANGLNILHRSDLLHKLMQGKKAITIAGTHGKTTTTAMIAHLLDDLGLDPSVAVGGTMLRYDSPARYGKSDYFIAEADESDGSFLKYRPFLGLLTNVASDHMEFFKNDAALEESFSTYLSHVEVDGYAIIGWDNPVSRKLGSTYAGHRLTFGFIIGSDVRSTDYACHDGETTFTAIVERETIKCRLKTIGKHNVANALCALAVARVLGLNLHAAAESLAHFAGVKRRLSLAFTRENIAVFDDYAHNPGKIAAVVSSLKEAYPHRSLHVIFQPHRFSRLATMYDEMLTAVAAADYVHVVPVYSAGELTNDDFSPQRLAKDIAARTKIKALPCSSLEDATKSVMSHLAGPAVVLTLGAGDVWRVTEDLKRSL